MASIKTRVISQEEMNKKYASPDAVCNRDQSPPPPKSLLQEAHEIIHGDREQTYGAADKNLKVIASYWSVHLSATTGEKITLTPSDVCGMMILLKQARLANSPAHRDSLVDIAGYAGLQDLCNKASVNTEN